MSARVPEPAGLPLLGHLWHWTAAPLRLLRAGARTGPVFRLRLWRPALVGYGPEWNRAVLSDPETFRSRGSLSGLTPYLSAGIVHTDPPHHRVRRRELNRHFTGRALDPSGPRLRAIADAGAPVGTFDARAYARRTVRQMLNATLFDGAVSDALLARFLAPLDHGLPVPMLHRPWLFRAVETTLRNVVADPPDGSVAAHLTAYSGADVELRVALAAGYDTTSHALAWALWHLAEGPNSRHSRDLGQHVDEVLRMYPAGWVGSRVAVHDTYAAGVPIPAGTLVLYSPYLTHHDPAQWPRPHLFRPERFASGRPSWTYLPFAAGPRTCLGAHLARLMLVAALAPFRDSCLRQVGGDPRPRAGITLRPRGPLLLHR